MSTLNLCKIALIDKLTDKVFESKPQCNNLYTINCLFIMQTNLHFFMGLVIIETLKILFAK